jgi:hypothetical protein
MFADPEVLPRVTVRVKMLEPHLPVERVEGHPGVSTRSSFVSMQLYHLLTQIDSP